MSVKRLIDEIMPQISNGYNRTGSSRSVLGLLDDGQRELFDCDPLNMRWIGDDNEGFPPYLTTVSGTYEYEITATNLTDVSAITKVIGGTSRAVRCKRVLRVFADASNTLDYGRRWMGPSEPYSYFNPLTTATTRLNIFKIPCECYDARENDSARILFPEDPGDTTDSYFCEFIWEPPPLVSEQIPLTCAQQFERSLEDYAIGIIQTRDQGKTSDRLNSFYDYWKPRFETHMKLQTTVRPQQTPARYC